MRTRAYNKRQNELLRNSPSCGNVGHSKREPPSPAIVAEAVSAVAAGHQTITAALMGDPLPGRSALDRMQGRSMN